MSYHHQPNQFAWADLAATDSEKARAFYSSVFGWTSEDTPLGDGRHYTTFKSGEASVCGMLPMTDEERTLGGSSFWTPYIQSPDVDQTAAVARMNGAAVLVDPFDMGAQGKVSILQDPTGAIFAARDGGRSPGPSAQPGNICWYELHTVDLQQARSFYSNLFQWREQKMPIDSYEYYVMSRDVDRVSGITGIDQQTLDQGAIPQWLFYVTVTDCDAAAAQAQALGAQVLSAPTDIPNVGRSAVFGDPVGATVGVLALSPG